MWLPLTPRHFPRLLERHEASSGGTSKSSASVLAGLVSDGELGEVVADHVGLHLHLQEANSTTEQTGGQIIVTLRSNRSLRIMPRCSGVAPRT